MSDSLVGTVISDRYEILTEVGKGRIGIVYKANHRQLDRLVAIKVLFEEVGKAETSIRRFEREARAASRLNHPNIITVYDFGLSPQGFPFLVMEFIDGVDLQHVVATEGRMSAARAVRIAAQVCSALGHAHKRGVIHRDLKPSNIMLVDIEDMPDFVKLVDFGIAKKFDADEDTIERLTMEGQVLGTPAYMSPEQCQAKKLDARSDVYSIGCVVFKMLTGATPITGTNLLEIMQNHIAMEPLSFAAACPNVEIPYQLEDVVMKALSKDPQFRQQSMSEFRAQLMTAFSAASGSMAELGGMGLRGEPAANTQGRSYGVLMDNALKGDAMSQYELSIRYQYGDGVEASLEESAKWLRTAAHAGQPEAQYRIGKQLLNGEDGVICAPEEGFRWLLKSAEQGYEPAQSLVAACFEQGSGVEANLANAVRWYRAALKQGNRNAEARLSNCYLQCFKTGQQAEGFTEWLTNQAAAGDVEALYAMACHIQSTASGIEARHQVMQYLSRAAEAGHVQAQLTLAQVFLSGGATPEEEKNSIFWLGKAVEKGDSDAITLMAVCLKNGRGVAADPVQAMKLLQQAAELKNLDAQTLLGAALLTGDGVPRNLTRGIGLLKSAANDGSSFAQWKLGLCCKSGNGTLRDPKEADKWFAKSAEGCFDQGPPWKASTPALQFSEAVQTFVTLSNLEHRQAMFWLGICYEYGLGVPRDLARALEYYMRAGNKGYPIATEAANRLKATIAAVSTV